MNVKNIKDCVIKPTHPSNLIAMLLNESVEEEEDNEE